MDCYEKLANGIIIQAAKDYEDAYIKVLKNPESKSGNKDMKALEQFFLSNWYACLTEVDGNTMISMLQDKCRKKLKEEAVG